MPRRAAEILAAGRAGLSAAGRSVSAMPSAQGDANAAWALMDDAVRRQAPLLCAPQPAAVGLCSTCRGRAAAAGGRCYQCGQHEQCAPGSLADVVVPVAYARKGGAHARHLWLYKSGRPGAAAAGTVLRAMTLTFLRDHGPCVWQRTGLAGPTHLAVVPSGRGRPGDHPLRALLGRCLRLPWAELAARPGSSGPVRELDPARFTARRLAGAAVALLDDTWTTGSAAQSAVLSLRQAGARAVAVIVLGRHLPAEDDGRPASAFCPEVMPFRPASCAVHHAGCD